MHAEPLGLRGAQVGNLWFKMHDTYMCVRGFCHSLQEAINTSATSVFGEKFWLNLLFKKKLFLKGCLTECSVQTAAVMLVFFGTLVACLLWATPYDVVRPLILMLYNLK